MAERPASGLADQAGGADESAIPAGPGALPRPQPVGVFPLPAGLLLIGGDSPESAAVRAELVAGRRPDVFPPGLRHYELALDGDLDGALAALDGDDLIALVNRLVLAPELHLLSHLRARTTGDLRVHVETVAHTVGLAPAPPDPAGTDGELAAMVHATVAAAALERHDRAAAVDALEEAARLAHPISAPLAGQFLGQMAHAQLDEGGTRRAAVTFQAAIDALTGTDLRESLAELHVACGAMHQEMAEAAPRLMKTAIDHYLAALGLITAETAPETFAIANANLGLAYLTMPMQEASDLLRMGIAVQSMREALGVLDPDVHPERWSSTQLNLANALVYLPSTHQADNIGEAVRLYEEVLERRDRHRDPQGRARVLANQGNALAHLGQFAEAKSRLHEARALFEEFEEHEAVRTVRFVLDEIAGREAELRSERPSGAGTAEGVRS
ncbi:MAG: hypothetical protein S0880_24725 [Actinomycetota bacterium]|nr:hypothetical protein [Actinomycetota bacterium]